MSIHPGHSGPPPPKMTLRSTGLMQAFDVDDALALRAEGVSWEEIARIYRTPGWYGSDAADEAAHAIWEAVGEPGAPRWEDQPICACGAWESGAAANGYFLGCDTAFERWLAEHGGPV